MVRSRFTAVHIPAALFGSSQMPGRMEGIFPTWVGFPALVMDGNFMEGNSLCGADPTGCIFGGTGSSLMGLCCCGVFESGEGERICCERWEMVSQQLERSWRGCLGPVGRDGITGCLTFNIHVMHDMIWYVYVGMYMCMYIHICMDGWRIKCRSFTPKSKTRDAGHVGKVLFKITF